MPTPTYVPLATVTLASTSSTVSFSNIPTTYQDIVLVLDVVANTAVDMYWRANGDNSSSYNRVQATAFSSGPVSNGVFNTTEASAGFWYSNRAINTTQIIDYSATDKHKTSITRSSSPTDAVGMWASRWANNSPITSLSIFASGNYLAGSVFSLYGILA
jgi:hypothetical protein